MYQGRIQGLGRGLWGLKPPPSKFNIVLQIYIYMTIVRYCSQVGQVLLHPVIACNALFTHFLVDDMTVFYLLPIIAHSMIHKCQLKLAFSFDVV